MKKWSSWIVVAVFALWLTAALRPPSEKSPFAYQQFGQIPVLLNGRVQPMDSVARNTLLILRGKQSVYLGSAGKMSASEWIAELMMRPETANDRPVFRVDHPELIGMLHLSPTEKHFSFNQIRGHWSAIETQARRINQIESAHRTPFERQLIKLQNALVLYYRIQNSLRPEGTESFAADIAAFKEVLGTGHGGTTPQDEEKRKKLQGFMQRYQQLANVAYPLVIPPLLPHEGQEAWKNMGTSLVESLHSGQINPAVEKFALVIDAYRQNQAERFNKTLAEYRSHLAVQLEPEMKKAKSEFLFRHYEPFYKSSILYVVAFLFVCFSWFNMSVSLNRTAFRLVNLAFLVHTAGLIVRMVLEGRPPVTNLYSSAVFVGWGAVALGAILEKLYRDGIGSVTASVVGFLSLIVAHNLAQSGDTMEMLRAVLDTNFWLATHVVTITLGYSALFVAGFLAIIYLLRGIFSVSLTSTAARALSRMVYGIICFGTLFSFLGTILGGIWADQSWGRFWGWDPKENGALLIVIWCSVILHARWGGLMKDRGLMMTAVFGNIVTAFSWFGVNMLGVGLHAYGFMDQAFKWLLLFMISQAAIIALAFIPQEKWRSARALKAAALPAKKTAPRADEREAAGVGA